MPVKTKKSRQPWRENRILRNKLKTLEDENERLHDYRRISREIFDHAHASVKNNTYPNTGFLVGLFKGVFK